MFEEEQTENKPISIFKPAMYKPISLRTQPPPASRPIIKPPPPFYVPQQTQQTKEQTQQAETKKQTINPYPPMSRPIIKPPPPMYKPGLLIDFETTTAPTTPITTPQKTDNKADEIFKALFETKEETEKKTTKEEIKTPTTFKNIAATLTEEIEKKTLQHIYELFRGDKIKIYQIFISSILFKAFSISLSTSSLLSSSKTFLRFGFISGYFGKKTVQQSS